MLGLNMCPSEIKNAVTRTGTAISDRLEVRIGLETHVQLISESKLFCSCKNPTNLKQEAEPNTLVCDVCLGMPGTKPRLNKAAIEAAIKVALALNCRIAERTFFSRKTYFYPDMNKNFQITQYEIPIAKDGWIEIRVGGNEKKRIRIRRVHIEEDPAKIIHADGYTLVDYNRAGVPLVEIVTEPDFESAEEARHYLQKLSQIMEYLGVYDSTSSATMKSDANISLKYGDTQGGRVELKNITGAKEIECALNYEIIRQKNIFKRGSVVARETRAWNERAGVSKQMRVKEEEEEYGYIFEPDLTVIEIDRAVVDRMRACLPELPDAKMRRFIKQYSVKEKTAETLTADAGLADLFEKACMQVSVKTAASWISVVLKTLNYNNLSYRNSGLKDEWIIELMKSYEAKEYSDLVAEKILRKMVEECRDMNHIVKKYGFRKIGEGVDVEQAVDKVIGNFKDAVKDYLKGKTEALNFLVGQVMRETKGAADPKDVRTLIVRKLNSRDKKV